MRRAFVMISWLFDSVNVKFLLGIFYETIQLLTLHFDECEETLHQNLFLNGCTCPCDNSLCVKQTSKNLLYFTMIVLKKVFAVAN